MSNWIGQTFTSNVGWRHLERLVDIGDRMAGSEGERRAAEATLEALEDISARNTRLNEFNIQAWRRGSSSIQAGSRKYEGLALPMSPSEQITGQLIDLGHGLPADFEANLDGAVVMTSSSVPDWFDREIHRREKYERAVEAGAAAFLFRNHRKGGLILTGSIGREGQEGEIPAVGLSKEVGTRLARQSTGQDVTVEVTAETFRGTSQNLHADIGPETDQELLLTCHLDAHDITEGAGDNAAGTAMVVEIANALSSREVDLDTRIHILCCGAEELGLIGSGHAASERDQSRIKAVVNNDGVATHRTLKAYTHGFPSLYDAVQTVSNRLDHPIETVPRLDPHTDHWPFVAQGVPGIALLSETQTRGRGWGHTAADTIDKLDIRDFREQAILITSLVTQLTDADTTVAHREPSEIADQLSNEGFATAMKTTGDWPY